MPGDRRPAAWDLYWTTVEGQLGVGPSGFIRWALPFLASGPGNDVIELGSGAGRDLRFLLESGFRVRGVDFSTEAVRISHQFLATLPGDVASRGTVERGEAEQFLSGLPPEDSDAVVGIVLYQTFSDEELTRLFGEVRRVLKPGGLHLWCVRDDLHPLRERKTMIPPNQGGAAETQVSHTFFSEARCNAQSAVGFERVQLERRAETHYLFVADRKPGALGPPPQ